MAWKGRELNDINFDDLQTILVNSKLQSSNNPLYQVISELITRVRESKNLTGNTLKSITGKITVNDSNNLPGLLNAITTINAIIQTSTFWVALSEVNSLPNSSTVVAGAGITLDYSVPNQVTINSSGAPIYANYLTYANDTGILTNFRQLLAGSGITFDDTVPFERTIRSTGGVSYIPMVNGAQPPELMNNGASDLLLVPYIP